MSDIHLQFGDNIRLLGPRVWAESVRGQLLVMMMFRTGHAVISEIWAAQPRHVTIRPYPFTRAGSDAQTIHVVHGTPAGEPVRDSHGHSVGGRPGTGQGSSSTVRYSPGRFSADTVLRVPPFGLLLPGVSANAGVEQTTVLLHELCHSLRSLYGAHESQAIRDAAPGQGAGGLGNTLPRRFGNTEELFAITVTNVFCSERHLALRADHSARRGADGQVIRQELQAEEFWREPTIYRHLQSAITRMPRLAQRLAGIDTAFNPFREIQRGVRPYLRMTDGQGRVLDPYSAP